jgi:hypothetical protein
MKARTFTPMGSMHPILFFVIAYVVALLFSIFICSSLFYSCNARPAKPLSGQTDSSPQSIAGATSVMMKK